MPVLKGWKYAAFIGGIVSFIGIALYPIVVHPIMNINEYKRIQKFNRRNIKQEDVQPGNMKVWTDPFDRKK